MTQRMLALVLAVGCAVPGVWLARAELAAADDRVSRRAAEMALPDPYLDPSWPDAAGDEMEGRYAPGKSDSVEEIPLDEDLEMQEELRAAEELTGETPLPGGAAAAPVPTGTAGANIAGPAAGSETLPAAAAPQPYAPPDDENNGELEERDPVEW